MKVCTDACLFAAVIANEKIKMKHCIDIGTGTGLLSLMLAQKDNEVQIDAVEIEADAALQAAENINASPWANRIKIINENILSCKLQTDYDCIICNPPFYENDLQSADEAVNNARHHTSLKLTQLAEIAAKHLSGKGTFAILLPFHRIDFFISACVKNGLHLSKQILIRQTEKHSFFRGILFFKKEKLPPQYSEMAIKSNGHYTKEFEILLKDYYLNL